MQATPPAAVIDEQATALMLLRWSVVGEVVVAKRCHVRYAEWLRRATDATAADQLMAILSEMGAL